MEIYQHNFKTEKPQSIFTAALDDPMMNDILVEEIKKCGDKHDHKTNVKAYMTDWQMADKPGFDRLANKVIDIANHISQKYYNCKVALLVKDMWGMIYKKNDYAIVHDHWPALWSGVYYINAPKGSGDLYWPQLKKSMTPQKNTVVLFDGYLRHGVKPNRSDDERIAVSFNLHLDRKL